MAAKIWASVSIKGPGMNSGPTVTSLALAHSRSRLKACIAICWSVVEEYQFGLITGGSLISADEIVTFPRETGATRATRNEL